MIEDDERIAALRAAIVAQADAAGPGGWLSIPVDPVVHRSGRLRVPRGAFEHWCVWRAGGEHLAAPWRVVSPQGVKQAADDPFHSDWVLGGGLAPGDMRHAAADPARAAAINEAAYAARSGIEARLLGHSCSVLLGGPDVEGRAWHPRSPSDDPPGGGPVVAVLRDARPDWLDVATRVLDGGGAVVVERGGEMAHLVTVMRQSGVGPVVRLDDARRIHPDGSLVQVSPSLGRVELRDDGRIPAPSPGLDEYLATSRALAPPEEEPTVRKVGKAFDLRRCRGDSPADRAPWMRMDRGYKAQGREFQAVAVLSSGREDSEHLELVVRVFRRSPFEGMGSFYAGGGRWPFDDVRAATIQALDMFEPPFDWEADRRARQEARERRLREFRDGLRARTDAELVGYMEAKVEEVTRFHAEVAEGRWDMRDQIDITEDHRTVFDEAEAVLAERGLPAFGMPREPEEGSPGPAL